jgi:hypothetical protein
MTEKQKSLDELRRQLEWSKLLVKQIALRKEGQKLCCACGLVKPIAEFVTGQTCRAKCRNCNNTSQKARHRRRRAAIAAVMEAALQAMEEHAN